VASLGELVAGIAHEINNPLAFALSHLDTALRSVDALAPEVIVAASERQAQHWHKLESRLREMGVGLGRIRDLVVKLRTFSRLDGDERGVASMRACVDSVLTILGHRLQNRIRVVTEIGEPDEIECYPGLLNQAVMNLTANSVDAVGEHGTITIRCGKEDDRYVVSVADTGPGIPESIRQRIFEPFFTTKPVGSGTGLGLSITYSIVEKHRGTIDVDCPAEGGTVITLSLPLVGSTASATPGVGGAGRRKGGP
jgi:two-component system NtrC family sensor kinase